MKLSNTDERALDDMVSILLTGNPKNPNERIEDVNDLTPVRIRTIYVQYKYQHRRFDELSKYYNLPLRTIAAICKGELFTNLTKNL